MQTITIALSEQLKEFVDFQVASGRFSTASEYICALIRDDEKRKAQQQLEAILTEGLHSSAPSTLHRQDWEEIRREALKQFEARNSRTNA